MHGPAEEVNTYDALAWLSTTDGFHVPTMPFDEVVGKIGTTPPAQIDPLLPMAKVGITFGFTVTVNVVVVAHRPAVGVNVYVPEF